MKCHFFNSLSQGNNVTSFKHLVKLSVKRSENSHGSIIFFPVLYIVNNIRPLSALASAANLIKYARLLYRFQQRRRPDARNHTIGYTVRWCTYRINITIALFADCCSVLRCLVTCEQLPQGGDPPYGDRGRSGREKMTNCVKRYYYLYHQDDSVSADMKMAECITVSR